MAAVTALSSLSFANTVTLHPGDVPDAQTPRVAAGDAPAGFGPDSWMNAAHVAASGYKVNAYVTPQELFGHSITINDIASITYYTKAPVGQENWFINVYTVGPGDASWYGKRFFNAGYTGYASDDAWHNNTITSLQRSSGGSFAAQSLTDWQTTYGSELVQSFSPQTNSGLNGNDAQIDGLVVTLKNGEIGSVDFAAVPTPSAAFGGLVLMGLTSLKRRR